MAKKETEYQLAIRIKANMDKTFTANLTNAESKIKSFRNNVSNAFNTLDSAYDKITNTLGNIVKLTTAATVAIGGVAVKAGKEVFDAGTEFESAFAGVKKTVDATEEEFAVLRSDILELSKEIPATANEIAETMEIAGQLGIANENLTEFTKTMINLGVSTNMTSEEAATALARFSNIKKMDPSKYEALGSVVVDLGNNFATTESEIVEMATRLASTGEIVGLTEAEIMAAATAMSSLGIEAQAGGSTLSKLLLNMDISKDLGGERWEEMARIAGMTADEFSKLYDDSALKAIGKFTQGLNDTERTGKSAAVILQDLGFKEVRMTRTLLSLASGNDLLYNAMERADEAWEENIALSEEAGKRYETMESRVQILKNTFEDLKITSYDTLRGYFAEGVEWLRENLVKLGNWVNGKDGLASWIEKAKAELPKITNNAKKFAAQFKPIADTGMKVLKYAVQHPDALAKLFIGLGAVLASYKILSTINGVVTGITTLVSNPVTLGIIALTAAIGGFAAVVWDLKKKEDALINTNLEKHFGNISLSLSEIDEAADHLLNSDGSLDKLHQAFEEWNTSETFLKNAEALQAQINKYNWKIQVGIGLNEDEQNGYKQDIQDYIEACNLYVAQQGYALDLSLNMFVHDYQGSSLQNNIHEYQESIRGQMESLGKQLADWVNLAFEDGVLTSTEAAVIAERMQKMADLQNTLTTARQDAQLKMLGLDADYSNLTPESFEALINKANEIEAQAAEERKTTFAEAYAAVAAAYKGKEGTQEYIDAMNAVESGYYELEAESKLKTVQFATEAIKKAYAKEYGDIQEMSFWTGKASEYSETQLRENSVEIWRDLSKSWTDRVEQFVGSDTEKAVQKIMDLLLPNAKDVEASYQKYLELGGTPIEGMTDALTDVDKLRALTGDIEGIAYYVLENIDFSETSGLGQLAKYLYDEGYYIPMTFIRGMSDGISAITGLEEQNVIKIKNEAAARQTQKLEEWTSKRNSLHDSSSFEFDDVSEHASGGIFGKAHFGVVAENGPESIIPLNGSREAKLLWKRTGELLGLKGRFDDMDGIGTGGYEVNYSPTIVFNGAAPTKEELDAANDRAQEKFEMMLERYLRTKARVAF